MIESWKFCIQTENALTILPRILLAFSRRRVVINTLQVQLDQHYAIEITFSLASEQVEQLLAQIRKMEEVLSAQLQCLIEQQSRPVSQSVS